MENMQVIGYACLMFGLNVMQFEVNKGPVKLIIHLRIVSHNYTNSGYNNK